MQVVQLTNKQKYIQVKVSLKASKERSLSSPPALGVQVQEVLKDMQTLSKENTASHEAAKVAFSPQALGTMVSWQDISFTVMHQPLASLAGSTVLWAETAATRAREATVANFMVDMLGVWCVDG